MIQASVRLFLLLVLFLVCGPKVHAQYLNTQKSVVVQPDSNKVFLDFFTIPESIQLSHADSLLSSDYFSFDIPSGVLTFHWPTHWTSLPVELLIQWRFRPISLPQTRTSPYSLLYIPPDSTTLNSTEPLKLSIQNPVYGSSLVSTGSITRGITVGNSRDPGLDSGLNFNLQGQLTESVTLSAALSDQNAIIQPEGTTQNLREFDQVYIRLESENDRVQMGDVDANFAQSSIARLQRRIQGATVSSQRDATGSNQAVMAVQRGTFRVMEFSGRDGVQGPYRLSGERGETFILVVAGTERVFLDGILLNRGEDQDYIIDYSIGEITFTGKQLMRNSHGILVEFQYLSSSYNRTLFAAESDQKFGKNDRFSVGATFIRESDAINFVESGLFSQRELEIIENAGADESRMRVSGADSVGFRPDAPYTLYVARDTLIMGEAIRYYEHRPGDPQGVFRVTFTRVGSGNGSYRRQGGGLNGIIYEWVGPGSGEFEPFRQLTGPKQTQLIAVRGRAQLSESTYTSAEWAGSSFNPNRLSMAVGSIHDHMVRGQFGVQNREIGLGMMSVTGLVEYKGMDFRFFDRVRDTEFDRQWGLSDSAPSDETRYQGGVSWNISQMSEISYDHQQLVRSERKGIRHEVAARSYEVGLPYLDISLGLLNSGSNKTVYESVEVYDAIYQTGYVVQMNRGFLIPDIKVQQDRDLYYTTDHKLRFGHEYEQVQPSMAYQTAAGNRISVGYQLREEKEALNGLLTDSRSIRTPELQFVYTSNSVLTTDSRIGYQRSRVSTEYSQITGASDSEGLAVRSQTTITAIRSGIVNEILYDLNTESRSLLQETYLEVGSEFGQYVWIDLNNDQIQQLDEFFPEQNPNEGTFILQLLPTDELRPVTSLRTSWNVRIDPIRWIDNWRDRNVATQILANTVYLSRIDFREQSEIGSITEFASLRAGSLMQDETTISGNLNWRQELQLFRRVPTIDATIRRDFRKGVQRQINGLQTSQQRKWDFSGVYRFPKNWSGEMNIRTQNRESFSEAIVGRNYVITGWAIEPGLRYNFEGGSLVRVAVRVGQNKNAEEITATQFNILQDGTLYFGSGIRVLQRVEFRSSRIDGQVSPQLEFELTESTGVGNSLLWNLGIQWDNADWVRTTLQFDGRTIPGRGVIQTLRMAVTALF